MQVFIVGSPLETARAICIGCVSLSVAHSQYRSARYCRRITNVGKERRSSMECTQELKNALSTLGVSYEECGGYMYEYTICGVHYHDESDLIWCGLFGFSYTGIPLDEMQRIYKVLDTFKNGKNIDNTQYIYAYLLEAWGFTDYGFSICKQELTDKGRALYCLMQSYYDAYER